MLPVLLYAIHRARRALPTCPRPVNGRIVSSVQCVGPLLTNEGIACLCHGLPFFLSVVGPQSLDSSVSAVQSRSIVSLREAP
jgi:hypothetical protein